MGSLSRPRYNPVPPISISPIAYRLYATQTEVGRGRRSEKHAPADLFEARTKIEIFFIGAQLVNALKWQTKLACYYESGSYHAISGVPEWPQERRNLVVSWH
jgi:hypothetical protein